jgi:16S rRNA (adenine1518-N6/adenine1519-N6)-dimethyltransferase
VPRTKRWLGQHFLSDPRILARIADALTPAANDTVLEIGPGPGGLTAALAARVGQIVAIEKDRDLAAALRGRFANLTVVEGDALALDWHTLLPGSGPTSKIAGNIPYNITSPLIDKALKPPRPAVVVFLVQKEVAERVTAAAGTPNYGALTVGVQAVAKAERLFTVPAGAFAPCPKVDSALLRLTPLDAPLLAERDRDAFRRLVVGLFGFRRKQLLRGLRELTGEDTAKMAALLQAAALDDRVRPEVLTPDDFVRLYRALVDAASRVG